jgi:lipopolysaccharide biosynthesis glycosyltransferase
MIVVRNIFKNKLWSGISMLVKLNEDLKVRTSQRDEARDQRDKARVERDEVRVPKAFEGGERFSNFGKVNFFCQEGERVKASETDEIISKSSSDLTVIERELLTQRAAPRLNSYLPAISPPNQNIAFLTVGNDRFVPGLEALVLSLLDIYPNLASDFYIYHDGSISEFSQMCLKDIYSGLIFVKDEMDWLELGVGKSDNQRRIGKLGYMNINALKYSQYEHMIVLDSDLIIQGDISALWESSDAVSMAHDIGDRPYATYSESLGDYVKNSGVIAIPNKFLTVESYKEIQSIVINSKEDYCEFIDRFADQKAWNIFLKGKCVNLLPLNYNCNVKYVAKYLEGRTEFLSIVHFAGPKPWLIKEFIEDKFVVDTPSKSVTYHELWRTKYRRLKLENRLSQFERFSNESLRKSPCKNSSKACLLIGNGPSINKVDFSRLHGFEKITFNWFVNYDGFDDVAPDHLVIASHMFFGGWIIQAPTFPEGYLEKLRSKKHKPVIWAPFYFKNLFKILGLEDEFECNYLLFEKPFKSFIDHKGWTALDPHGFLDDGRTGVLSFGVPMTKLLGYSDTILLGCDSNYNRTGTEANYFYENSEHTSLSTNKESLTNTWLEGGAGQYCYEVVRGCLEAEGRGITDATIDGALVNIPKMNVEDLYK